MFIFSSGYVLIGKHDLKLRYFLPIKCFWITFSNLNFIHKKVKFVLSFMVSFIQKIISFSLFLSYCLTNILPSLLILPDFIPLQLCSFFRSWLPIVYQASCQSWDIKYLLPWSLPSQNSFPTIQAMCYPLMYNLGYSTYFLYVFGSSHGLSIRYLFRNFFLPAKNSLTLAQF